MWVAATFAAMMAFTAIAAPTSDASPTTASKEGLDREGLDQDQLRLLGLPYGRLASKFWDFIKVANLFILNFFIIEVPLIRDKGGCAERVNGGGGNFYQSSHMFCQQS